MSDAASTDPSNTESAPTTQDGQEPTENQDPNSLPKWARDALTKANDEAAKARIATRELREAKAAQAKLAELEDGQKSEAQRLKEQLAAAQQATADAEAQLMRMRLATRHGLTEDDMDLLGTGDEDVIEARAARIAAMKSAAAAVKPEPTTVTPGEKKSVETLRPGATPADTPLGTQDAYPAHWLPPGVTGEVPPTTT